MPAGPASSPCPCSLPPSRITPSGTGCGGLESAVPGAVRCEKDPDDESEHTHDREESGNAAIDHGQQRDADQRDRELSEVQERGVSSHDLPGGCGCRLSGQGVGDRRADHSDGHSYQDHHRQSGNSIENPVLSYIEPYASSACEMVAEILQYITDSVKLRPEEADAMYAGLMIDTNNFISKTGVRTFEAAAFLKKSGADITRVRLKLRDDMQTYKARAEAVKNASVEGAYAYAECPSEGLESPTVVGAQVANELLNITGVEASFVFTVVKCVIYVSARSYDSMNVQLVMERLGGGGHSTMAGTQLKDMTVEEAVEFFAHVPSIRRKMETLNDVGLSYIRLGQPSTELSGGEAQRIKLATELSKRSTGKTIYILDEPTTGLHFADVHKLVEILKRLSEGGNTVVVIEHNLDVIKTADYIIDIGPEGGDKGGTVVALGTPEEVAQSPVSYTGKYVKKYLK